MENKKKITLNGRKFTGKAAAYRYLKRRLSLPGYFGNNLDALHDCLTENGTPRELIIKNPDKISYYLGEYGESMIQVFLDSAEENRALTVTMLNQE